MKNRIFQAASDSTDFLFVVKEIMETKTDLTVICICLVLTLTSAVPEVKADCSETHYLCPTNSSTSACGAHCMMSGYKGGHCVQESEDCPSSFRCFCRY